MFEAFDSQEALMRPVTITLQGLIEDDGSQIPEAWSVTNAVILEIQ